MTGIRYSVAVAGETTFGVAGTKFFTLPAGAYMSATYNVSTETVYSPGSKFFDTVVYGKVSGSFEISYTMSYEHMELLRFAFEDYDVTELENGKYKHTFSKANNARIQPFTIRRKTINDITGPTAGQDETTLFKGCVIKSVRISQSSGSGKMSVTMSGYFQNAETTLGNLNTTDYREFDGQVVEWACLFIGDKDVANVESLTLSIDNGAGMQYTTCRDTAVNYYEDKSSFQFGMTCYSNDFLRYKALVYTGGQDASNAKNGNAYRPLCKNRHPIPRMAMRSFDTCRGEGETVYAAFERAGKSLTFNIEDCIVKSATWQKGDGSRMLDQMSSAECKRISIEVVNDIEAYDDYDKLPASHRV